MIVPGSDTLVLGSEALVPGSDPLVLGSGALVHGYQTSEMSQLELGFETFGPWVETLVRGFETCSLVSLHLQLQF